MANVIYGGADAFDAVLYPEYNPINREYIQNQFVNISSTLDEVGVRFMENARAVYDQAVSSKAAALARAAIEGAKGLFHPNRVRAITEIEQMQAASPVMQRWVMSCPEVRSVYQNGQCAGYGESYIDPSPGGIRETDYNWRRVMNGVLVEREEDLFFVHYPDELLPEDRELTPFEQFDILRTWDYAKMFMDASKEDPTDPFQGNL